LSKKKQHDELGDNEKLLPSDALGLVMILHGEQFGEDSAFGMFKSVLTQSRYIAFHALGVSLVKFGRAQCKIATLQEAHAVTFKDTFITSLQHFNDGIKEYEYLNKKLENRRYDLNW